MGLLMMSGVTQAELIDSLRFGEPEEEKGHELVAEKSEVAVGAHLLDVRRLLPTEPESWRGGKLTFQMKVDGEKPNYFTAAFWGSDVTGEHSRLSLSIDGKQVGQRHLGEVDLLDIMHDEPRFPKGFLFKTLPLPTHLTAGKESVELSIEAQGPIWGYGREIARYQKNMTQPSRGIYAGYVHTESWFIPPGKMGELKIPDHPVRTSPGPEVLDEVKKYINDNLGKLVASNKPLDQEGTEFVARGCWEPWCVAYENKKALEKVVESLDHFCGRFLADKTELEKEWDGYGRLAVAVQTLEGPLKFYQNGKVAGTDVTRKDGWARMFIASRDWHVQNRRAYTNQSLIVDMFIYACNRAVRILDPTEAWKESQAIRLLHESAGIEPWSGAWDLKGDPSWSKGRDYFLYTKNGLTRELGYVGAYGEIVTGFLLEAYQITRPKRGEPGDPLLKKQLTKVAKARSIFRYPLPDPEGFRDMQLETVVGWRDWYYPGGTTYEQMHSEGPLEVAAATLDPVLVGIGQQMLEDNQYFKSLQKRMTIRGHYHKKRLIAALANYEKIKSEPAQSRRLPMSWEQPDFVFADPEVGVVAVKNGKEVMFISLYWRARFAVNFLSRVHHITPALERDAIVWTEARFDDSGEVFVQPDRTNQPFKDKFEDFYHSDGIHLAVAGETQPIAKVPKTFKDWKPGQENIFAGKAQFYLLEYGPYLVAMNCTEDKSFPFELPDRFVGAMELGSQTVASAKELSAKPGQTYVFWKKR